MYKTIVELYVNINTPIERSVYSSEGLEQNWQ